MGWRSRSSPTRGAVVFLVYSLIVCLSTLRSLSRFICPCLVLGHLCPDAAHTSKLPTHIPTHHATSTPRIVVYCPHSNSWLFHVQIFLALPESAASVAESGVPWSDTHRFFCDARRSPPAVWQCRPRRALVIELHQRRKRPHLGRGADAPSHR